MSIRSRCFVLFDFSLTQAAPTPGYHCHESRDNLEFFVFNPAQIVPQFIIHWKAVRNTRLGKEHAGAES